MAIKDEIAWFKTTFGDQVRAAIAGTPFTLDLIAAIATQETGYLWPRIRKHTTGADGKVNIEQFLYLCVGDTLDKRSDFPKSRAALERVPRGKEMFAVARRALEAIAKIDKSYAGAARNKNKFAHGFGIFQNDIQAFTETPAWFLNESWRDFSVCLTRCLAELERKRARVFGKKTTLTRDDLVYVAIAYNRGSANLHEGFQQGFRDDSGKYYGERIDQYMKMAEKVGVGN